MGKRTPKREFIPLVNHVVTICYIVARVSEDITEKRMAQMDAQSVSGYLESRVSDFELLVV